MAAVRREHLQRLYACDCRRLFRVRSPVQCLIYSCLNSSHAPKGHQKRNNMPHVLRSMFSACPSGTPRERPKSRGNEVNALFGDKLTKARGAPWCASLATKLSPLPHPPLPNRIMDSPLDGSQIYEPSFELTFLGRGGVHEGRMGKGFLIH